ncbi:unnamed protein product [Lupinus luteus]|uniref:Uncharacterized protein n=1 Tax=Lupinus luteus TaxID=3873 RepID=A0AAV1W8M5_LUPLU
MRILSTRSLIQASTIRFNDSSMDFDHSMLAGRCKLRMKFICVLHYRFIICYYSQIMRLVEFTFAEETAALLRLRRKHVFHILLSVSLLKTAGKKLYFKCSIMSFLASMCVSCVT